MHNGEEMKKIVLIFFISLFVFNVFSQNEEKRDALSFYREGNYAAAIAICEDEISSDPERVDAYVVMCWALIANKQYAEARQRAQDGLRVSSYDLRLIESLAEACYYLGQNNAALEQFQRFVANAPDSNSRIGSSYYYMGEIYIRQARYQHADIAFTTAVQKRPQQDSWWVRLGYARERAGNYYESLSAYDEALRLNPALVDAQTGKQRVSSHLR